MWILLQKTKRGCYYCGNTTDGNEAREWCKEKAGRDFLSVADHCVFKTPLGVLSSIKFSEAFLLSHDYD